MCHFSFKAKLHIYEIEKTYIIAILAIISLNIFKSYLSVSSASSWDFLKLSSCFLVFMIMTTLEAFSGLHCLSRIPQKY